MAPQERDGTYLPVEVSTKILADGRWEGIVRDITRRKAAEEAARLSEARLAGIISIAADAIISIDEQQRIVMYNEGATRIFGWSSAEVVGKPLDLLIPGRFAEAHRAHVQAFDREHLASRMMQGRPVVMGRRKSGEEFPAEAAISKLANDGQRLFNVFLRDVTVTKQLQAELRRAVERFRFLAEAGEILGSSLDTEDITRKLAALAVRSLATCCIIELSDRDGGLIRTRGPMRRTDRARDWCTSSAPHSTRLSRSDGSRRNNGRGYSSPTSTRDGFESHVLDDATVALIRDLRATSLIEVPIVAGDRVIGTMLFLSGTSGGGYSPADLQVAVDLALRTGLAAENGRLYRAAQLATRAKDEMLSIVVHDLRSPLTAAQFAASLLALEVPENRRAAARKAAETIHRSIRLATRLVEDLLDVASIEAGKLTLDLKEVSPEVLVQNAVESCLPLAASVSVQTRGGDRVGTTAGAGG